VEMAFLVPAHTNVLEEDSVKLIKLVVRSEIIFKSQVL
jgi:hypothetical protein